MTNNDYGLTPTKPRESDQQNWLTSFSDLVTILMVFFVIMISPTNFSALRYERSKEAFQGRTDADKSSISEVYQELQKASATSPWQQSVKIEDHGSEITITLPDHLLFALGQASIHPEFEAELQQLTGSLRKLPIYAKIAIEGYTDDNPIHTSRVRSNWHLSSLRALSILERLEMDGICKANCELRGFGETRPFLPNRDQKGTPIAANQAQNRRVVIRIY